LARAIELFVVPKSMPMAPLLILGAREDIRDLSKVGSCSTCMSVWREAILSLAISRAGEAVVPQSRS
jgi:hypothetical protein